MAILIEYKDLDENNEESLISNLNKENFIKIYEHEINSRMKKDKPIEMLETINISGIIFRIYDCVKLTDKENYKIIYPKIIDTDDLKIYGQGKQKFLLKLMNYDWSNEEETLNYNYYVIKFNNYKEMEQDFLNNYKRQQKESKINWLGITFAKDLYSYESKQNGFTPLFPSTCWTL